MMSATEAACVLFALAHQANARFSCLLPVGHNRISEFVALRQNHFEAYIDFMWESLLRSLLRLEALQCYLSK